MKQTVELHRAAPILLLLAACWAFPARAEEQTHAPDEALEAVYGRCLVRFTGTSTLHEFAGTAPTQEFVIMHHGRGSVREGWWSTMIRVPVADMSTGLGLRDRTMRKMFHAKEHEYIEARFPRIDAARFLQAVNARHAADAEPNEALAFQLRIAGVERTVRPIITRWRRDTTTAVLGGRFDVSLEAFGLKRPGFLGAVRVGDRVFVTVEVELATSANIFHP